jgi:GTPase SAR1 family protein
MAGSGDPKWQKDAADQNFDYMFKLLIIGNSSVGKTSFLFRYADDSFTSAFVSTVGIDFKVKTVFRHDKRVKLQIWVRTDNFFKNFTIFLIVMVFRQSLI